MSFYPVIRTPRGSIKVSEGGIAELTWNPGFGPKWTGAYTMAQLYVDSEVYRLCEPFTPKKTGMLIMSGELGTEFGIGEVIWLAPYSRPQYYMPNRIGSETGPLRGPRWFERMKAIYGKTIVANAKKILAAELAKPTGGADESNQ